MRSRLEKLTRRRSDQRLQEDGLVRVPLPLMIMSTAAPNPPMICCRNTDDPCAVWIEEYNIVHPHSGLRFLSPREFLALSA